MKYACLLGLWITCCQVVAQDTLALSDCFEKVETSRYSLMLENAEAARSEVNLRFHKYSLLPSVNAFGNIGAGFGRILDNVSNQFSTSQVNAQSFGVNSSLVVFDGFNFYHKKNELRLMEDRAVLSKSQSLNSLYHEVVSLYVDLCLKQSEIELSNRRVQHYEELLTIQRQLIAAGKITRVDTMRSENLVKQEKVNRIRLGEQHRKAELRLNVLMGVDVYSEYHYEISQMTGLSQKLEYDEVYLMKKNAIELKLLAVNRQREKSAIMPSLRFDASVGTRYSTSLKVDVFDPQSAPMGYGDQLDLNLYQNVGFQLNVPIFNRGEYVKKRALQEVKEDGLRRQAEFLEVDLKRKQIEVELLRKSLSDQKLELERSVGNLENIYAVTMEVYANGKITFSELQDVFVEWQSELLKLEAVRFELTRVECYIR